MDTSKCTHDQISIFVQPQTKALICVMTSENKIPEVESRVNWMQRNATRWADFANLQVGDNASSANCKKFFNDKLTYIISGISHFPTDACIKFR